MKLHSTLSTSLICGLLVACSGLLFSGSAASAIDVAGAEALAKSNKCLSCHAATKTKSGPSWTKIAAKYKGKPEGEQKVITQMTTGPSVKLEDGTKEDHKIIKTTDMAKLKNIAQWILSF